MSVIVNVLKHVTFLHYLYYRRIRGDIIDVYKIITGKYDPSTEPQNITAHSTFTRGN